MGVAVVVPAFNHRDAIVAAVFSALKLDNVDEIIVVDDGSADDTAAVAASLEERMVKVVRRPNGGPSAARNAGARVASASHLVFLDAEDVLLPSAIDSFVSLHDQGYQLVRSGVIRVEPDGTEHVSLAQKSPYPYPRGTPLAGSFSIARSLFDMIGGYDENLKYGENSELLLRAQAKLSESGKGIGFCGQPTVKVTPNPAHDADYYRQRRLAAIERMLSIYRKEFERDRQTLHNHHAIASVLYRQEGDYVLARQHGWAALRLRPWSARSWIRFGQAVSRGS